MPVEAVESVDCVVVGSEPSVVVGEGDSALVAAGPDVETDAESEEQAAPTRAHPRRTIRSLRMVRPYGESSAT
jgi:hypothetical protein